MERRNFAKLKAHFPSHSHFADCVSFDDKTHMANVGLQTYSNQSRVICKLKRRLSYKI